MLAGPAGVTDVIAGTPPRPVLTSWKSPASTPETGAENVTVQWTEAAFVGLASAATTELTVGTPLTVCSSAALVALARKLASPR